MRRTLSTVAVLAASAVARGADDLAERARAGVRDVLVRPEFQPLADADRLGIDLGVELDPSWRRAILDVLGDLIEAVGKPIVDVLGKALRWLFRGLGNLFGGGGGAGGTGFALAPLVQWALFVLALGALAFLVYRLMRSVRTDRQAAALALNVAAAPSGNDDALARSPEDWRRRAQGLAASGRHVEALRALYLELLSSLHRVGAIDYDRSRTNTAYVGDLVRDHAARAPFVALTSRFDRAVYGGMEPSGSDVNAAEREVDAVRSAFAREALDA